MYSNNVIIGTYHPDPKGTFWKYILSTTSVYIRDAATIVNFSCLLETDVETGLHQIFSIHLKNTDSLQKLIVEWEDKASMWI